MSHTGKQTHYIHVSAITLGRGSLSDDTPAKEAGSPADADS